MKVEQDVEAYLDGSKEANITQGIKSEPSGSDNIPLRAHPEAPEKNKFSEEVRMLRQKYIIACNDLQKKSKAFTKMQSSKESADRKYEMLKSSSGIHLKNLKRKLVESENTIASSNNEKENLSSELAHIESKLQQCAEKIKCEVQDNVEKAKTITRITRENRQLKARLNQYHSSDTHRLHHVHTSVNANYVAQNTSTNEYEVDRLLSHKIKNRKTYFLVRWKGFTSEHDTWESENNLKNCRKILTEYLKTNNL